MMSFWIAAVFSGILAAFIVQIKDFLELFNVRCVSYNQIEHLSALWSLSAASKRRRNFDERNNL